MAKHAHDGRSDPHLRCEPPPSPWQGGEGRNAREGAKFRGNKATIWFRISKLTQKWPENKANRPTLAKEIAAGYPANPKNKANF